MAHLLIRSSNSELQQLSPIFPALAAGDIQGAALFFSSKMVVPSAKSLFATFMGELLLVGFVPSAPQKVRRICK